MIDLARSGDPEVLRILRRHPRILTVDESDSGDQSGSGGLQFCIGDWNRAIVIADDFVKDYGLVELMDNNPIVCADRVSLPSPTSTLALIALGPLAAAGLIVERPTVISNDPQADELDIASAMRTVGWDHGVTLNCESTNFDGLVALTAMAAINTPGDLDEIDDLYNERFGGSFFVRRDESGDWSPGLLLGQPQAVYRLRITPDDPLSLLTVHVIADRNGKCGAAQIVHCMNVMCGFEESLGL